MEIPTVRCREYVTENNLELWHDDSSYFIIYPSAKEAVMRCEEAYALCDNDGNDKFFEVHPCCKSVLKNFDEAERIL